MCSSFVFRIFKRSDDASQNLWWTVRALLHSRYCLDYHPSSSNITRCQVRSCVRVLLNDSGWYRFLSNVFQSIRINYFTSKNNMITCPMRKTKPFLHFDTTNSYCLHYVFLRRTNLIYWSIYLTRSIVRSIYLSFYLNHRYDSVRKVFASHAGDQGSIPG